MSVRHLFGRVVEGSEETDVLGGHRMVGPPSKSGIAMFALMNQIERDSCKAPPANRNLAAPGVF